MKSLLARSICALCCTVLALGAGAELRAAAMTFRFEAEIESTEDIPVDLLGNLVPGDRFSVAFMYIDFVDPIGIIHSNIHVDFGSIVLSSQQYTYEWSDNGAGNSPRGGDGVFVSCLDGIGPRGCGYVPIVNTEYAWNGSFGLVGPADIFANPETLFSASPADSLRLAANWNRFTRGGVELLIEYGPLGPVAVAFLHASIIPGSFHIVPEPCPIILACPGLLLLFANRQRLAKNSIASRTECETG